MKEVTGSNPVIPAAENRYVKYFITLPIRIDRLTSQFLTSLQVLPCKLSILYKKRGK